MKLHHLVTTATMGAALLWAGPAPAQTNFDWQGLGLMAVHPWFQEGVHSYVKFSISHDRRQVLQTIYYNGKRSQRMFSSDDHGGVQGVQLQDRFTSRVYLSKTGFEADFLAVDGSQIRDVWDEISPSEIVHHVDHRVGDKWILIGQDRLHTVDAAAFRAVEEHAVTRQAAVAQMAETSAQRQRAEQAEQDQQEEERAQSQKGSQAVIDALNSATSAMAARSHGGSNYSVPPGRGPAYSAAAPAASQPTSTGYLPPFTTCIAVVQHRAGSDPAFSHGGGFFAGQATNNCGQPVELNWCEDSARCGMSPASGQNTTAMHTLEPGQSYPVDIIWWQGCRAGDVYKDGQCHH